MGYLEISPPPPPPSTYRLLYVGADLDLLEFLQNDLRGEGWFVVRASSGGLGLFFLAGRINYHLLLFDEMLPDMSGGELAQRTRSIEHRRDVPLILLSSAKGTVKAGGAGEGMLLQSPQPFRALADSVRRLRRLSGDE